MSWFRVLGFGSVQEGSSTDPIRGWLGGVVGWGDNWANHAQNEAGTL